MYVFFPSVDIWMYNSSDFSVHIYACVNIYMDMYIPVIIYAYIIIILESILYIPTN